MRATGVIRHQHGCIEQMKKEKWTGAEIVLMCMLIIMTTAFMFVARTAIAERRESAMWKEYAFTFCEKVARTMREKNPLDDYSCKFFSRSEK